MRYRKKVIFSVFFLFILCFLSSIVFASSIIWNRTYGGVWGEIAYSIVETSDMGYAIAGYTQSFGEGDSDFWLIKTDSNGNIKWNKTYGGKNNDRAYSMIESSNGGFVLAGITDSFGAGNYDFWLVKTDSYGDLEWNQTFGGPKWETAYCLVETSDGGYALAGDTYSFGAGELDFWLVKTDSNGKMEWNQTYGGEQDEGAYSLVETSDGGYALTGFLDSFSPIGGRDCWLIKTDKFGNLEWNQTYGGAGYDYGYSLIETSDEGYALVGNTGSFYPHFWMVKTDNNGVMEWYETYPGDVAYSVIESSEGGFVIAGSNNPHRKGKHILLVKVDSQGIMEWHQTYTESESEQDVAHSLIETSDGGYALVGYKSRSSFDADGGWLDIWMLKTDEMGDIPEFSSLNLFFLVLVSGASLFFIFRGKLCRHNLKGGFDAI
jgi:hypothetical protein